MNSTDIKSNSRVVVTGMGIVSCLDSDLRRFWEKLTDGFSGIKKISKFDTSDTACQHAALVPDIQKVSLWGRMNRYLAKNTKMLACACLSAIKDAGYDHLDQKELPAPGMIIGSAFGNYEKAAAWYKKYALEGYEGVTPMDSLDGGHNTAMNHVAIALKAKGVHTLVASGGASSLDALGSAYNLIKSGRSTVAISGGYENIFRELNFYFSAKGLLTVDSFARPFDRNACGMILGEGSAILVLESLDHALNRNSRIYGELIGFHKAFTPAGDQFGFDRVMLSAIDKSGIHPEQIDYVCACGNGLKHSDLAEARAMNKLFASGNVYVNSIKGALGDWYGASGAVQTLSALMTLCSGIIPATYGCTDPVPLRGPVLVLKKSKKTDVQYAIINSFDCFGFSSSLVVKKYKDGDYYGF